MLFKINVINETHCCLGIILLIHNLEVNVFNKKELNYNFY